jgi:hypothetical protein
MDEPPRGALILVYFSAAAVMGVSALELLLYLAARRLERPGRSRSPLFIESSSLVAAEVTRLKFPWKQSFIQSLLTSAATSLTGYQRRRRDIFVERHPQMPEPRQGRHIQKMSLLTELEILFD